MKPSQDCLDLIIKFEGISLKPYLCPAKIPTIGVGATMYENGTKVKLTDKPITKERAYEIFKKTISQYENAVNSFTRDDINTYKFDA